jgi:hypothetical protein
VAELHNRHTSFIIGGVRVCLAVHADSKDAIDQAEENLRMLSNLLKGLATKDEAELYAKLLNGPTLDERLGRIMAPPCGCRGKQ